MPGISAGAGSGDGFLSVQAKRAGKIKGESAVPGHEDEIVVSSWRWGVQASSNLGATAATARRSYSGLTVVKSIDSASTALLAALATNDEIKEAVLTMRKAGGEAVDYFFIKLQEARVTQVEHTSHERGSHLRFPQGRGRVPAAAGQRRPRRLACLHRRDHARVMPR